MTGASIREVLAEIGAQPPARWEPLLVQTFPDDPALVQQALLWLRTDLYKVADDAAPPSLGDGDERYLLSLRLDAGATAAVWQAYDKKLGRNVAIKLFHSEHAEAVVEALAEARAACDVISDHVVRVLDVYEGARPYIVMELVGEHDPRQGEQVPGGSAAALRPASIDEAIRWVCDVARGVHDAHLRDVFHRDLKPHNVLITPVSRRARIADFGLSVSGAAGAAPRVSIITGGTGGPMRIAGTPEYMAPEQARGLPQALDPADADDRARLVALDVWGLGALAYDLLAGRAPWAGERGELEPWERAASGERPPALRRTSWGERIPPRLARVIDKAMADDPAARYASAAELGRELDAVLERRPTSLDRTRLLRAWLWCRRNPQLSLTGAAAVVLAMLTFAAYLAVRDLRARSRSLDAEVHAQESQKRALAARAAQARAELATTEDDLRAQNQALASLRRSLAEEQKLYKELLLARDKALADADAATRQLVEQLTIARSDRDAAELGREMYEGFWDTARKDAETAGKERDQAEHDRDAARAERDQAEHERDAVRAERDRLQADRDHALAEVTRLTTAAATVNARIEELSARLHLEAGSDGSASVAATDAGVPTAAGPGSAAPDARRADAAKDATEALRPRR